MISSLINALTEKNVRRCFFMGYISGLFLNNQVFKQLLSYNYKHYLTLYLSLIKHHNALISQRVNGSLEKVNISTCIKLYCAKNEYKRWFIGLVHE